MNFYFYFIQRIHRLVSEFPLFLKTWMHIWFLLKRERESWKEKEREVMRMPRGMWGPDPLGIRVPASPKSRSALFFQMKIYSFANDEILQDKCLALEPFSGRIEESGVLLLSPVLLFLTPLSVLELWLSAFFPTASNWGLNFWNIDFHLVFNEIIYEKCLGYCLTENNQ